jgi:hypothetical protein
MPTSHFERSALMSPREFYQRDLKLTGTSRGGWARAHCIFYRPDRNPSLYVNIDKGNFICHACGAKGHDIIAFVMLRYELSFPDACRKLGAWNEQAAIGTGGIPKPGQRRQAQQVVQLEGAELERFLARRLAEAVVDGPLDIPERAERFALRDEIHCLTQVQQQVSDRLSELRQGATPICDDEEERCWHVLSLALDDLRSTEAEYMRVSNMQDTLRLEDLWTQEGRS